jgi:hypothetical protein
VNVLAVAVKALDGPGIQEVLATAMASGHGPEIQSFASHFVAGKPSGLADTLERFVIVSQSGGLARLLAEVREIGLGATRFFRTRDVAQAPSGRQIGGFVSQEFQVPELESAVQAGGQGPVAVGRQIDGTHGTGVGFEGPQAAARSDFPDAQSFDRCRPKRPIHRRRSGKPY